MSWSKEEDVVHVYHMMTEVCAKVSIMDMVQMQELRGRLVKSAAREEGADSIAMRCLITAVDAYINDLHDYQSKNKGAA